MRLFIRLKDDEIAPLVFHSANPAMLRSKKSFSTLAAEHEHTTLEPTRHKSLMSQSLLTVCYVRHYLDL
jgi:hypothetical protein